MLRRILVAFTLLLVPTGIALHVNNGTELTLVEQMWEETCAIIEDEFDYSCEGAEIPIVVFEDTGSIEGYYAGDGIVHISWDLKGYDMNSVIVHEMVHHVHTELDMYEIPGYAASICMSESDAFQVMNVWLIDHGMRPIHAWYQYYPPCWQFVEIR